MLFDNTFIRLLFLGIFMNVFLKPFLSNGSIGDKNGISNVSMLVNLINKKIKTATIPTIPIREPPIINIRRYVLIDVVNSGSEKGREDIAVIAITIIIIGDTMPADTAASPNINAPTIDRADPLEFGTRYSLSFIISNASIIKNASINAGNGTPFL